MLKMVEDVGRGHRALAANHSVDVKVLQDDIQLHSYFSSGHCSKSESFFIGDDEFFVLKMGIASHEERCNLLGERACGSPHHAVQFMVAWSRRNMTKAITHNVIPPM
eukprot:GILJ01008802.1.p2 GENE.GILJ01008802.1~~GILJ01008802.1.p2  ORF type:complete len:107 (+),score=9.10 GILJ01008802.1:316-636(+)